MNQSHLPRTLINLLFILVVTTFLAGVLRAFEPAQAALVLDTPTQATGLPTSTSISEFPSPGSTPTPPPASLLPPPAGEATLIPTPAPTATAQAEGETSPDLDERPLYISDMTGIIALGILMVVVVLVGVAWGRYSFNKNK